MPARASAKRAVAKPRPAVNTDRLTVDIVEAAANLLRAFAESPAGRRAHTSSLFLSVRLFATTLCRAVAHLTEFDDASRTLDAQEPVTPSAHRQLLLQRRVAWLQAKTALERSS